MSSSCSLCWYALAFIFSLVSLGIAKLVLDFYWRPLQLHRSFRQQGIPGPEPRFFYGNMLQIRELSSKTTKTEQQHVCDFVYPFYRQWSRAYGDIFLFWLGCKPNLMLSDPDMIKEVLCDMSKSYDREPAKPVAQEMFGEGVAILRMNDKWSQQRKMVGSAFTMKKIQLMISKMTSCVEGHLLSWSKAGSLDADFELKSITSDVICRTAFGTSYEAGKKVFEMQVEQGRMIFDWESCVHFPGSSLLPSSNKRYRKKLKSEIERIIQEIVANRLRDAGDGDEADMLGMLVSAEQSSSEVTLQNVIDECKTFFFTGQETSASLLSWTVMLLASNPDQQQLLRDEVLETLEYSPPETLEQIGNLKKMEMAFQEALRLFPPIPRLRRYVWQDTKLRSVFIPRGTVLHLPLIATNYNEKIWGNDVEEFRPQRFESVHRRWFTPFSLGPRSCIGQNFAMVEVKIILAMILQKFQFKLSESYVHEPLYRLTLQPKFGIPIELTRL